MIRGSAVKLIVPGLQVSRMYSPLARSLMAFSSSGETSGSKPVPPDGSRTKRLMIGVVR